MKISIYNDYDEMSKAAAQLVLEQLSAKPASILSFPSGDTPTGTLNYLVQYANEGKIDLGQCYFVGLDEWIGMDENDIGSCKYYLQTTFFSKLNIDPEKIVLFDAKAADLDAECKRMNAFISDKGGLDIMMVGIGMNGHIGLNEPGTDFNLYAHTSELDPLTVQVGQKYFKQQTSLSGGITLGLKHFSEAKQAILIASGAKKAAIIAESLKGQVTTDVPASLLQTIHSAVILLDQEAALHLEHAS